MDGHVFPAVSKELADKRRELAPDIHAAFRAFGQRVFGDAAAADMLDVLTALAGYPPYAPLFQSLERAGVRSPRAYAAVARRARAMTELTGRRAFVALAQYQGALALITRLGRVGAITPDLADQLVRGSRTDAVDCIQLPGAR